MGDRREKVKKHVRRVMRDYQNDLWFRAEATVRLNVMVNAFYAIYQTIQGIRFQSIWFAMLAVYYVMLTVNRVAILRFLRPDAADGREELRRYRKCGWYLLILTLAVLGLGVLVNFAGRHPVYPGSMIYVVGAFTLFTVWSGIKNAFAYRKLESPIISASKAVALACSLVSLYSLQAAALALYCTGSLTWIRQVANVASAFIIGIIVAWMAIHIIVRATRALQGKEDLSLVAVAKAKAIDRDNNLEMEHYRSEAQRQLETWQSYQGTKVEWKSYSGAHDRRAARMQERLAARDERKEKQREKNREQKKREKEMVKLIRQADLKEKAEARKKARAAAQAKARKKAQENADAKAAAKAEAKAEKAEVRAEAKAARAEARAEKADAKATKVEARAAKGEARAEKAEAKAAARAEAKAAKAEARAEAKAAKAETVK